MEKGFLKLKRKVQTNAWVKSLLIGIPSGLILFSLLYILEKREILSLHPVFCVLIGIGVALLTGGLIYLLNAPRTARLAKKLDKDLQLHEKVQTMLEYEKEEGTIYVLQRNDTNETLDAIPKKRLKIKNLWVYVVTAVFGVSALVTSFVVPPKKVDAGANIAPPVPFQLSGIQRSAIERLIEDVSTSTMETPYKENIVEDLNELLGSLSKAQTIAERNVAIDAAFEDILKETDDSSSVVEIVNSLWNKEQENLSLLAEAINYYDWGAGKEWDDYMAGMSNFQTSFIHADATAEAPDEAKMAKETGAILSDFSANLTAGLLTSGIEKTDSVYAILTRLNETDETVDGVQIYGLKKIAQDAETVGYANTQTALNDTLEELKIPVYKALEQNYVNTTTGEYAIKRIADIFRYPLPKFERPDLQTSSSGDSSDDLDDRVPILPGTDSENVYGSNEKVLDPTTGELVEYGKLLSGYQSEALENCTEEEWEILKKYYDILAGVNKEKEEDENYGN